RTSVHQIGTAAPKHGVAARSSIDRRSAAARAHEKQLARVAENNVGASRGHRFAATGRQDRIEAGCRDEIAAKTELDGVVASSGGDRVVATAKRPDRVIAVSKGDIPGARVGGRN